ncbi:MAG: porphobilinogen synthase, partial [Myxococcales bacterium]|nr:porphobilinogen synthase [Myxococcales bacterium]
MSRLDLLSRPRRNRKSAAIRDAVRETWLGPEHFIYPLFIHEGSEDIPISSMPGKSRLSPEGLLAEVGRAVELGIRSVVLFPAVAEALKSADGRESFNPE